MSTHFTVELKEAGITAKGLANTTALIPLMMFFLTEDEIDSLPKDGRAEAAFAALQEIFGGKLVAEQEKFSPEAEAELEKITEKGSPANDALRDILAEKEKDFPATKKKIAEVAEEYSGAVVERLARLKAFDKLGKTFLDRAIGTKENAEIAEALHCVYYGLEPPYLDVPRDQRAAVRVDLGDLTQLFLEAIAKGLAGGEEAPAEE